MESGDTDKFLVVSVEKGLYISRVLHGLRGGVK